MKVIEIIKTRNLDKFIYGVSVPESVEFWQNCGAEFDEEITEEYPTISFLIKKRIC